MLILIALLILLPLLGEQLGLNLSFISAALAVGTRAVIKAVLYVTGNA
jgi:hypothetical protein